MAAMHSDKDHQPNTTVAEIAGSCLRSFQECVRRAVSIHPRELSLVEDQLARFSVWAANIRVFSQGRASSDHRLREAPDVQDAVIGLLQALDYRIQNCTQCLESFSSRDPRMPLTDIDPKLDQSVRDIASEISLLHRFSNTIRRASHEAQNSKAAESFRIRDDEGNDAEALLTALFFYHVRDRFPTVGEHICQRLADTMVLRRKRILYKRSRYGDATIRPQQVPSQPRITLPKIRPRFAVADQSEAFEPQAIPTRSKSTVQSLTQSATTLSPEKFVKASAPSVVSVSKTVALSSHGDLIFPPAPLGMEFQVPNSHMERSAWRESVDAIGEVTCPFCFYALPAQDVVDNKKWKLHVKGDLEAYVCLFDDCSSAHELYGHSTSWLKHMREHAMRWRCTSKSHGDIVYESRDEYLSHMRSAHGGKFSEAQLRVLADRNGRVMGPLFKSCPLCAEGDVNGAMDDHIVGHLRFLALKSLPTYEDEGADDMGSEKGSSLASRPRSRSTIRDDPERGIPPTFDDSPQGKQVEVVVVERGVSRILELEDTHSGRSEWGFIPVPPETFRSAQDDPILQGFLNGDKEKKPLHPIPIRPGDASRDDKYFSHEGVGSYRRNHEITPSCTFCAKKGSLVNVWWPSRSG
ncbi:hypothetical protein GGR52DRAFT_2839 [Hypoxylon sp. FL1284]|nr:hypothetical protein GGR52DRAFT_2839 [Hypoxylon sp. FL1284]